MFIDSHCHLFSEEFNDDLEQALARAKENGVDYIIVPATDLETSGKVIELADKYDFIFGSVGVHPHDTKDWNDKNLEELEKLASHKKIVAIGEIGLDYYYDFSPKEKQIEAFRSQIELALKLKMPVIIHNRDADDDMMKIVREYTPKGLVAQFHCFNSSLEAARELIELRHYISFTGNITFKKAEGLVNIVSRVQTDNLLIETDSPYMAPVPLRGKRNEPANVKLVAEKIAQIHHLSVEDVARTTSYNAYKLYGIGEKPMLSYTYKIGNSLYINVTNRCDADCIFCDRKGAAVIGGYNLKMSKSQEPEAEVYISEIGDPKQYNEIVFCGYGEPTIRWDTVKKVAAYVKTNGGKTRINTDGHGNIINKRNIAPEFEGLIDTVSISLNSTDPKEYARLMRVDEKMHGEIIEFAKEVKKYAGNVVMSIVGMNEIDAEKAKEFVEKNMGVGFRIREYF
jgi:TatD DNase family protein